MTLAPSSVAATAADRPAPPAPTIITSAVYSVVSGAFFFRRIHQRGNVAASLLGRLTHRRNQRVAGHRRARNRIHREGLLVEDRLRQFGEERLFADALALVMIDDFDLLDLIFGERRFHRHRAVVALRGRV